MTLFIRSQFGEIVMKCYGNLMTTADCKAFRKAFTVNYPKNSLSTLSHFPTESFAVYIVGDHLRRYTPRFLKHTDTCKLSGRVLLSC